MAATPDGIALRVVCDYCGSTHNYRGGERAPIASRASGGGADRPPQEPLVAERERSFPAMSHESTGPQGDLEMMMRRVIREESGLTAVAPAEKWRGGEFVLKPGRPGVQEKSWPIESFFHKVVMIRNRLRTLEQQVNASDLSDDVKLKLQSYITGCYGSLTSFNVLFADEGEKFSGSESKE